jgi:O-antigen biosynthesis protein
VATEVSDMDRITLSETEYCIVCGRHSSFRFDPTIVTAQLKKAWGISDDLVEAFNRKESMFCDNCGSSLRIRRLATVLMQTFVEISGTSCKSVVELIQNKEFRQLKIAEINACGALHSYLKDHPNLSYSECASNAKPGEMIEGIRCEDLQCLTYPDSYFDIILTSETLEHVPEPDRAWREIYRTLRNTGYHIFTIPIVPSQQSTRTRAQLISGQRLDLLEPAWHGGWGQEGMFVYTDFGMDVAERLGGLGLATEIFYQNREDNLDVGLVFRSRKVEKHTPNRFAGGTVMLEDTGERYHPWWEEAVISYEHLHRYAYATQFVAGKKVLDLACGEGYGSYLLAKTAESVIGIDIDDKAIKHAANKYIKSNIRFELGSITDVPISGQHLFQVITCFEAIEHVEDHDKLLREVKRLLTHDGLFLASTPNKWSYSDEPQHKNPFHVRELYFQEFKTLLERYFKEAKFLGQRVYCNSHMWPVFGRENPALVEYVIERNPKEFVFVEKEKRVPIYFISVASDAEQEIKDDASVLIDHSNQLVKQKETALIGLAQARDVLETTVRSQQQVLTEKDEHIDQLTSQGASLNQQLQSVQVGLTQKEGQITELMAEREKLMTEVSQLRDKAQTQEQACSDQEQRIIQLQALVQGRDQALREIETSLAWIFIMRYRLLRNKFLPDGSRRRKSYDLVKKAIKVFIQEGPKSVLKKTLRKIRGPASHAFTEGFHGRIAVKFLEKNPEPQQLPRSEDAYEAWLRVNAWTDKAEAHLRERLTHVQSQLPLISVVMPMFDPEIGFLEETVGSVRSQIYENWELCVADNASQNKVLSEVLEKWVASDHRMKVVLRSEKRSLSRATNAAAALAEGEFLVFLDQNDLLSPDALAEVALYLLDNPEVDFLYSDHDKIDESSRRFDPQFKPDWSPELILSCMYCGRLLGVRRKLFQRLGGAREGYEGSEDYDITLRATEQARQVGHIPLVLCHQRVRPRTEMAPRRPKPRSADAAQRALQGSMERRRIRGTVYQPNWALKAGVAMFWHEFPDTGPTVAVIVRTQSRPDIFHTCLSSIRSTSYENYEVIVVDNGSDNVDKLADQRNICHRVVHIPNCNNSFNFSAVMNRAVEQVDAEYVLFLNGYTEVREPRWLSRMVGHAQIPGVGAVGARLLFPDGRIQHCGIVHGRHQEMPSQPFKLLPANNYGYLSHAMVARNYSAISAACMLTSRKLFLELGGFDEKNFGVAYSDVDYCYHLVKKRYRCVYCPGAELFYHADESRGFASNADEIAAFRKKYRDYEDPWYNPNLLLSDDNFKIQPRKIVRSTVGTQRALMCSHNLNWEGAPQSQFELTIELKRLGIIEPIVYSPEDGPLRSAYESHGIEVVTKSHPLLGVYTRKEFDSALAKFSDLLYDLDVKLVYGNTLQTFYAIAAAERIGVPSLWNPRESEPWQNYFDFLPLEIRGRALDCFRYPYRVVFVSDATRKAWEPLNFTHNFTVIHNGLNIEQLKARCKDWTRETARRTLKIQDHETAIVLLGTVCPRKNQQDLPLALRKVPADLLKQVQCFIVGDKENENDDALKKYSNELKRLVYDLPAEACDRVHIVHETSDVGLYYLAGDIFLCTSRLESYPRVILEAMAFGLPIITTDVFGIKEQVLDNVNALFYRPGDADSLAAALARLISDKEFRGFLAENSPKILDSLSTFDDMVRGYAGLFQEAYLSKGYPVGKKGAQLVVVGGDRNKLAM